jgi:arabinose-5-phosphate isomerase
MSVVVPFEQEAGVLAVAPTTSSLLMMALGDVLALVVAQAKGFTEHDFARVHPGGAIGNKLNLQVGDVMHQRDDLPLLAEETLFAQAIVVITEKKLGAGIVVNDQDQVRGIITDGDLRRACSRGPAVFGQQAREFMTHYPKTILVSDAATTAAACMRANSITALVVVDSNARVVGLVHIHDLLKRGIAT